MNDTWSKDFVEHLRTVHFTLLTLSLSLVIIASSTKRFEYSNAQNQVERLRKIQEGSLKVTLRKIWKNYFGKPDPLSAKESAKDPGGQVDPPPDNKNKNENQKQIKDCQPPSCRLVGDIPALDAKVGNLRIGLSVDTADLLRTTKNDPLWVQTGLDNHDGMRAFWDSLSKGIDVWWVVTIDPASSKVNGRSPVELAPSSSFSGRKDRIMALTVIPIQSDLKHVLLEEPIDRKLPVTPIKLALHCSVSAVPSKMLLSDFKDADSSLFSDKAFEEEFPDAVKFIKIRNLNNHPFDEVARELRSAADKADSSATLFGILVPAEQVTSWGLLLLVGVQLYFWIHLCEFTKRVQSDSPGWKVAWIGMYDRQPAKSIYKLSSCGAPLLTASILVDFKITNYFGLIGNVEGTVLFLSAGAGLWLAALTYAQIERQYRMQRLAQAETIKPGLKARN